MEESKKNHCEKTRCDLCARYAPAGEKKFSFHSGKLLCADCLAEEESCGCEDDGE